MALTKSKAANIFTPEGNSLAVFIDINDGELKLKDVFGGLQLFTDLVGGGGLNLQNDALMTSTLTAIVDKDNTASALLVATNKVATSGELTLNGNELTNFVPSVPAGGTLTINSANEDTYNSTVYFVTGAVTITIDNSVRQGFNISVVQIDSNQATFAASGGSLTLRNRQSHTQTAGQYATVTLIRYNNDLILAGDTA